MAIRNKSNSSVSKVDKLYLEISSVLTQARQTVYRAVNFAMVQAYWQIGKLIVEYEQKGKKRAEFGANVLKDNRQLFASRYKLYLPTVSELKKELERERRIIESRMG